MKKTIAAVLAVAATAFLSTGVQAGVTSQTDVVPATATLNATGTVNSFTLGWTNKIIACGTFFATGTAPFKQLAGTVCPAGPSADATVTLSQLGTTTQPIVVTITDGGGFAGSGIVTLKHTTITTAPIPSFALDLALQDVEAGVPSRPLGVAFTPTGLTEHFSINPTLHQDVTSSLNTTPASTDLPNGNYSGSVTVVFSR